MVWLETSLRSYATGIAGGKCAEALRSEASRNPGKPSISNTEPCKKEQYRGEGFKDLTCFKDL